MVARALLRHGPLRQGLGERDAVDLIWRLASPELFLLMTDMEGLTPAAYADWLESTLARVLLED